MELKLPYINPKSFAAELMTRYGFIKQEVWNAERLMVPPTAGNGSLQLFIRNNVHFFRGKWKFSEETLFHSDDPVAKMGVIDFRISSNGLIQSAAIEGRKKFEFDTTEIDGLRVFMPESLFSIDKISLLKQFERYCLDKNVTTQLRNVFAIDPGDVKESILLESKILEFIHHWREYLNKGDVAQCFEEIPDRHLHAITTAKIILDKDILSNISIKELSLKSGLNEFDLKRGFRKVTGMPIHQYVIKCRMELAKQMVTKTNLPMQEIVDKLGYANRGHFANLYQKFFGNNPLTDRNSSTSGQNSDI